MFAAMLLLLFAAIAIASSVFWIVMIVECATRESNHGNDKLIWILIIIFTHWIGALAYYFVRRPQRIDRTWSVIGCQIVGVRAA